MPFSIQLQRFARLLQKKLGLQGYIPLTLLEDITPMVGVLSGEGPEDYFLREEELRSAQMNQPGAVGNLSRVALVNPADSGFLVVVKRVIVFQAAGATVDVDGTVEAASLTALVRGRPRDTRLADDLSAIPATPVGLNADNPAGVSGLRLWSYRKPVNDSADVELDVVLRPGTMHSVFTTGGNTPLTASFHWRQYRHGPQELTSG